MKKLLVLSVFFILLFLPPDDSTLAADRCSSVPISCVGTGNSCKSEGFDCNNYLDLPKEECEAQGGCFENVSCGWGAVTHYCFLSPGSPFTPEECGYIGRNCCGTFDDWSCHEGVLSTDFMDCTCREEGWDSPYDLCQGNSQCQDCMTPGVVYPQGGSWTALGCIPIGDTNQFVAWLMKRAIGIGGGIAFLLMIFASFQIITSSGDPKKLQAGKEMLGSAIAGLILIIFSLFLLQLIGVRILQIPGFGTP